jgi:hypothetical protein
LYFPFAEKSRIPRCASERLLDVPPRPRRGQTPKGKSRNGTDADEYWYGSLRCRSTPESAGSQPESESTQSSIRFTARRKSALIWVVAPPVAPPGWSTPISRSRFGSEPSEAASSLSGFAFPPCAFTQLATDSFAARPTATTSRTSPSTIALSKMRFRWLAIGERGSCASGRSASVYCP